jgi:predicted nucleic acid-binding protein
MIAAVALRHGAALLAFDRGLAAIARVVDLPLDRHSLCGRGTR